MNIDEIIHWVFFIIIIIFLSHLISLLICSEYYSSIVEDLCLDNNFTNYVEPNLIWPYNTLNEVACYNMQIVDINGKKYYLPEESTFIKYDRK